MFEKFQFRFLLKAIMAVAIVVGYSHQMMGQLSEQHHYADCNHSHGEDHHEHDHHNGHSHDDSSGECICLSGGVSFANQIILPPVLRAPVFSLSEIPSRPVSQNAPIFVSGIDHPPRG